MKRTIRTIGIFTLSVVFCTAFAGCVEKPDDEHKYIPPEIEYTIDESVLESGIDANNSQFYASNVTPVEDSPLAGKTIYWLGSSVTYGASSGGEAMAEFLAAKTGCISVKEAVSGTTIFDDGGNGNTGSKSYTRRLVSGDNFDKEAEVDAFICQISTNDAISYRLGKRGAIDETGEIYSHIFDRSTTIGGVEFIIAYVTETWGCPVYFYSGSYFGDTGSGTRTNGDPSGTNYGKLVEDVKEVVAKWQDLGYDVGVIDMFNDEDFNAQVSDEYYKWCVSDAIHPKRAGYLNWWMPYFEQYLLVNLIGE